MARILVVEDDEILRNGIAFALTREGYQVKTAGSLSGMRGQLEGVLDLVILDVSLPDGDSRDFLPCLRLFRNNSSSRSSVGVRATRVSPMTSSLPAKSYRRLPLQ